MKIGFLGIGNELLDGRVQDKNLSFLSSFLREYNTSIEYALFCKDDEEDIFSAINFLFPKVDIIITSGGLGPTSDDNTRNVIATFVGEELVLDESEYQRIVAFLKSKKHYSEIPESNQIQAFKPKGSFFIKNDIGTASGIFTQKENKKIIALPGVPKEFKYLVEKVFKNHLKLSQDEKSYNIVRFWGIGESALADELKKIGIIDSISIIATEDGILIKYPENYKEQFDILINKLNNFVVSKNGNTIEQEVFYKLQKHNITIATVESCTGGYISSKLVFNDGISSFLKGSIVAYQIETKIKLLKINADTINKFGVVSKECVREMAFAGKRIFNSDIIVATTGYIGHTGGDNFAKLGDVFIGIIFQDNFFYKKLELNIDEKNSKEFYINRVTNNALFEVLLILKELENK